MDKFSRSFRARYSRGSASLPVPRQETRGQEINKKVNDRVVKRPVPVKSPIGKHRPVKRPSEDILQQLGSKGRVSRSKGSGPEVKDGSGTKQLAVRDDRLRENSMVVGAVTKQAQA